MRSIKGLHNEVDIQTMRPIGKQVSEESFCAYCWYYHDGDVLGYTSHFWLIQSPCHWSLPELVWNTLSGQPWTVQVAQWLWSCRALALWLCRSALDTVLQRKWFEFWMCCTFYRGGSVHSDHSCAMQWVGEVPPEVDQDASQ